MNAILSIVLALACFTDPPAATQPAAASQPAPAVALVCGDWVDLALLLDDPCVTTCVVDVWMHGDLAVVTAVHSLGPGGSSECVWVGFYTFPSTIYAHSIVTVPFHADEME
jgi:hypothetical protein